MQALELCGVSKKLGRFVLTDVSLTLPQGYILGYVGQNGAGKTTTIRLMMHLLKPDSGTVTVNGRRFSDDPAAFKESIGYVADECYFPSSFTLKDTAETLRDFYPSFDRERFYSYAREWELDEKKKVKDFSKGMKTKLMFASVLSRRTELLVLDEPTGGLDPVVRSEILSLLQGYIEDGKHSVFFSTHIMSDLEKIADYLAFIRDGRLVFSDTKDAVLESYLLIRGGAGDLTDELRRRMTGFKQTGMGFEGLLPVKYRSSAAGKVLMERPSIDDIIVYSIRGTKGETA